MPAEYIVSMLSDDKTFERPHKYINDSSLMPDLNWSNLDQEHVEKLNWNLNSRMQLYNLWPQKTSDWK